MKLTLLLLSMLTFSSVARADQYHVKAGEQCLTSSGPGILWYFYCVVENVYETNSCEDAFSKLKQMDCCHPKGLRQPNFWQIPTCRKL